MSPALLATLVLLAPLASAAVIALFLRRQGVLASALSVAVSAFIAAGSGYLIFGGHRFNCSTDWLTIGDFTLSLGIKFDDLSALMLFVVGFVGFFIHVFSLGYMHDDKARARFFGGLSIFMFSMLGIVLADNLFMVFIFWELVGFSSWLLINHYHEKQSAADASKKAFIVNRIGDFGFILGIIWCYYANHTVVLSELAEKSAQGGLLVSAGIPLLLFCGAVGKSAQMPLHVWLPDAMEGPTPVSALIHAATMVAAGIFMLCRIQVLMVPDALNVIMWVGTITALYAALCAITQRDIKKVLAYSTLSQLGYMVAAFGLGSLVAGHGEGEGAHLGALATGALSAGAAAAMFHLTTHAFFKALLFLGSGSVIHGCHHEQDIFKMGGLARKMPLTFATFTIGVLAIIGMPGLAGFFSKDAILYLAYSNSTPVFGILAFTAILTAFYMIRMWKITFFGESRSHESSHAHESGVAMVLPLVLLAVLAISGGWSSVFTLIAGHSIQASIPEAHGSAHTVILIASLAVMLSGALAAWLFYKTSAEDSLERSAPGLHSLLASKLWIDEGYLWYVAKVQQRFALVMNFVEQIFIAGLLVRGTAGLVGLLGITARMLHTGRLQAYAWWFLVGVVALGAYALRLF